VNIAGRKADAESQGKKGRKKENYRLIAKYV